MDIPVSGGGTGSFRLGVVNNHWVFATPEGDAFWMRGVMNCVGNASPTMEAAIQKRFGQPWWKPGGMFKLTMTEHLVRWGFNTLGEYTAQVLWPSDSTLDAMTFIQLLNVTRSSEDSSALTKSVGTFVKDLIDGSDPTIYTGYRGGFPDVFDPSFSLMVSTSLQQIGVTHDTVQSRFLLGTCADDRDYLFGFGPVDTHPHLGWMAAVTAPTRSSSASHNVKYSDSIVYTKVALANFLKAKYGTITSLNASWGSTYTTWSSDGGWPNGHGLLDESGRNSWIGKDCYALSTALPQVRIDLDSFLVLIADQYFSVTSGTIRAVLPGKLVIGPSSVCIRARPQILREEGKYVDVIAASAPPDSLATNSGYAELYALTGKPIYDETFLTANADSPFSSSPGNVPNDYPNQESRGAAYVHIVSGDLGLRASDGNCPVVGIDWWSWTDSPGEKMNFGLTTNLGNGYDGIEDQIESSPDPLGNFYGDEAANYGNLMGAVRGANTSVHDSLLGNQTVSRPYDMSRIPPESLQLSVYPNPVSNAAVMALEPDIQGPVGVRIYSLLGDEVVQRRGIARGGRPNNIHIDVPRLASGVYILQAEFNGKVGRIPLIISK